MTPALPPTLAAELDALGPVGLSRAAQAAGAMLAADLSVPAPGRIDPVPVVLDPSTWEQLSRGLIQRAHLLDALHAELYGPRTIFDAAVCPTQELLADPAYLRSAVAPRAEGTHRLFALATDVQLSDDGSWRVVADTLDVPVGAGMALELRRVLSRAAPELYRSTALHRLHPFFDTVRAGLHARTKRLGLAGRTVVIADETDPLGAFDHHWFANLLGAPVVTASDLVARADTVELRTPGDGPGAAVDTLIRLVPSATLDPLDLGPTSSGGVTGLVDAARRGIITVLNPLGAGLLENRALRAALPDLCRHLLHEDLQLHAADGATGALWPSLPPTGRPGEPSRLTGRPVRLRLLVVAAEDGFAVLPGGIATTVDGGPATLKDVWVQAAVSAVPDPIAVLGPGLRGSLPSPAGGTTRSVGADLFWFGRYLERTDATARLLRTLIDTTNDLASETTASARTARRTLLRAVTDVTTTYPGFQEVAAEDEQAVRDEYLSLLTDPGRPGSLAQTGRALAATSRSLRDLLSADLWPALARMDAQFTALSGVDAPPLEQALSEIVDVCLTLSGAITDTMPRTLGYDLTEAGRRIERCLGLISLLRATLAHRAPQAAELRIASAVAAITEAGASYRRAVHGPLHPELLLELLVADPTHPRSLLFQLDRLIAAVDRLPELTPVVRVRSPLTALRHRVAGWDAQALLRPLGAQDPRTPLLQEADAAIIALRDLATAFEDHYFRPAEGATAWGDDDV